MSDYPNLEQIIIRGNYLKSPLTKLELGGKFKLTQLICARNQLTALDLTNCLRLQILDCSINQLTTLRLPNPAQELVYLDLRNNLLTDLSIFGHCLNCQELYCQNNPFSGLLQPLQSLNKLKKLGLENTNLDSGLEYLPNSLEGISLSGQLAQELRKHKRP